VFLKVNISFLIKMIFSDLGYITYHCSAVAFPISPTMVKISFSAFMTLLNSTPSIWPPSNPVHYIRIKFEVLKNVPSDFTQDILLQPTNFYPIMETVRNQQQFDTSSCTLWNHAVQQKQKES